MAKNSDSIIPLSDISNEDKDFVGEKAAGLGEMIKHGFPIPDGFVITPNAYHQFLKIKAVPETLTKEIFKAYKSLEWSLKDAFVEIFLSNNNLIQKKLTAKGEAVLLEKIKSIWQSRDYPDISPSVIVRKIPESSLSGIMFTIDSINNDKTKILIKEEKSGSHYEVLKTELKISFKKINKGKKQLLTDKKIMEVAALGKKLQEYYYFPQEVNFSVENNNIYITNIKPITILKHEEVHIHPKKNKHDSLLKAKPRTALMKGEPLYPGIVTGHLRKIQSIQDISKILRGDIVVIPYQDLIKHPIMKAGAIVAIDNRLHDVPHLTLGPFFSGKPTIITTLENGRILTNGSVVTVNGKNGEVYMGSKWQQ